MTLANRIFDAAWRCRHLITQDQVTLFSAGGHKTALTEMRERIEAACREDEIVRGYERYEAMRKMNLRDLIEIHERNMAGERFDDLVDEMVGMNH